MAKKGVSRSDVWLMAVFLFLMLLTLAINYYGLRYGILMPAGMETLAGIFLPNSDCTVDYTYAREVFEQRSLFPQGTLFTTEPRALLPAFVTAVLYGATGSLRFAAAVDIAGLSTVVLLCLYRLLREVGCRRGAALWGVAAFSLLYPNDLFVFNFFNTSYVQVFLGILTTLIAYFTERRGWWILSAFLAFLMALQSPRAAVILYMPLLMVVCLRWRHSGDVVRQRGRGVLLLLGIHCLGYGFLRFFLLPHYQLDLPAFAFHWTLPETSVVFQALAAIVGSMIPAFLDDRLLLFWRYYALLLVCAIASLVFLMRRGALHGEKGDLLLFCFLSGGTATVASIVMRIPDARYDTSFTWLCIFLLTFGLETLLNQWRWRAMVLGGCVLAAGFSLFQGVWGVARLDLHRSAQEYQAIRLTEAVGAQYVYATYWHNGPLETASNFRIRTGNLTGGPQETPGDVSLAPMLFGTNRRLYEQETAPQHVVLALDEKELAYLNDNGKRILSDGQFLGRAGKLSLWLFEKNPFVIGNSF